MERIIYVLSGVSTYLVGYVGGYDELMKLVVLCIVLDFVTGVMNAIIDKSLSSKISFRGIIKKFALLLFIGFCYALDIYMFDAGLREVAIGLVVAYEGLSIIENFGKMGVPIPIKVRNLLKQLQMEGEDKDENNR